MTRFLSFAGILTYYGFNILRFGLWLRLLEIDLARPAPPLRGGRRIDLPQGASPPPARLFVVCELWRGFLAFSLSAIGAILSVLDWSWAALGVS